MGAVLDLIRVLYEPGAVFQRVGEKPKFWAPFIALAVVQIVVTVLTMPFVKAGMAAQMAQIAQSNPAAAAQAQKFASLAPIFVPIGLILMLLIATLILWLVMSIIAGESRFGTLLSVNTYAAVTSATLFGIVTFAVLSMRGVAAVSSMQDLRAHLGLDLLAPDAGRFLSAFLGGINPFSIWGVVLVTIGVQVTHKTSRGTAATAAIVSFLVGLLVMSGAALLQRG